SLQTKDSKSLMASGVLSPLSLNKSLARLNSLPGGIGSFDPAKGGLTPVAAKSPSLCGIPPLPTPLSVELGSGGWPAHATPASGTDRAAAAAAVTNSFLS